MNLANTLAMDILGLLFVTLMMIVLGWIRDLFRAARRRGPGGRGPERTAHKPRPLPANVGGAAQIR